MNWFEILAGIASILSLIFTFYISRNISKVKKEFFLKVRGKEQFKKLNEYVSSLNEMLNRIDEKEKHIKPKLGQVKAVLEWFISNLDKKMKEEILNVLEKIKNFELMSLTKNQKEQRLWDIYVALITFGEKIENKFKDNEWT